MSRPLEDLGLIHPTPRDPAMTQPVPGPREGLLEAYKKHVEELRGIEDRQNKLIALLLGVFSAAATLLAKGGLSLQLAPKIYLAAMAFVIVAIGYQPHPRHWLALAKLVGIPS